MNMHRHQPFTRVEGKDIGPLLAVAVMVWLMVGLLFSMGCSVAIKQRVSESHQAVRLALTAFDDTEHELCLPAVADSPPTVTPKVLRGDCTNPDAAAIGLTSALNQKIAQSLIKAFEADKKVSAAIIAWRAGDPPPTDLSQLLTDAQAAFDVVKTFAPAGSSLLIKGQKVLDEIGKLVVLFGGGSDAR